MKKKQSFMKQVGLTLIELVIAVTIAIALGAGGIVAYKEIGTDAKKAAKNDLGAKVSAAIVLYMVGFNNTVPPTGAQIATATNMGNVACDATSGAIYDLTNSEVYVTLLTSGGGSVASCAIPAYSISIPE